MDRYDEAKKRVMDRVLGMLKLRGWSGSEFARQMNCSRQDVTNWRSRGFPLERLEDAAHVFRCSIDELMGRGIPGKSNQAGALRWPFPTVPFEEFDELDPAQKLEIGELVEDRIARFKAKNGPRRRKKSGAR